MTDYGHELRFGAFVTPSARNPDEVVALAVHSEAVGLDLVTFQDHPYQPSFLDTWTLLSWAAAKTSTIHLAPNVLNAPMRPAPVLARAAASLDLLSGGRLDLALGSGGFLDAMAAMGTGPLSREESVEILDETIDVLRELWDSGNREILNYDGQHFALHGAKRGPAPAHDIPLWLGALKPRGLRLIGAKADGWLPSLAYLKPGEFRSGNTIIDDAAQAAGRSPGEVRRLLNIAGRFGPASTGFLDGPARQWVDQLLPYVLDDGAGTFILASDDRHTISTFAAEVAPALREAVAAERAGRGTAAAAGRSARVRSRRHPGIRYDELPSSLIERAIEPGDPGYPSVRSTYLRGGNPALVLPVLSAGEVSDALRFARSHPEVPLSVRSGGHGISGRSTNDGGIVIDLSGMNAIEVLDASARLVRIGPGAIWMDVAAALAEHGWALSSGDYGGVGVGGLATAGGIGWLARAHGLTIDHLRAAEVVLADGTVVRTSETEEPDLFWAIRGAGANFGIVTSFEFEVDEVGGVGWAQLTFDATDTARFLRDWGSIVENSPRDLTSFLIMGAAGPGKPAVAQVLAMVDSDDPDTIVERLQPLADIAPLLEQKVQLTGYANVMANAQRGHHDGQGQPLSRSGLVEHITPAFAEAAAALVHSGAVYFFQIRSVGGAVADVPADATAYSNRSANFSVVAFGTDKAQVDTLWEGVYTHFDGLYLSFETDRRHERLQDAFPPETLRRLRVLKQHYDPETVFRDNFTIVQDSALTG